MNKAERKIILDWERFCASVFLSMKIGNDLEDNGQNTSYSCGDCTGVKNPLPLDSFLKSAIVYYHPSFIGYLKATCKLLKQAFRYKERKDFILIHRRKRSFGKEAVVFDNPGRCFVE